MLDIDLISEPPHRPPPPPPDVCVQCGNLCGQRGRKRFKASWGLRMSHICPCTPCPSPPPGSRLKVESLHFAHLSSADGHWRAGRCRGGFVSICGTVEIVYSVYTTVSIIMNLYRTAASMLFDRKYNRDTNCLRKEAETKPRDLTHSVCFLYTAEHSESFVIIILDLWGARRILQLSVPRN
jgi:hypothetical protein